MVRAPVFGAITCESPERRPAYARTLGYIHQNEDGTYVWKATADSFEVAKSTVQRLATTSPGEYMIFSQTTGDKIVVSQDGLPEPDAVS